MPLLQLRDFSLSIANTPIVKQLNFQIQPAQMLALVGESGSGKSVTAMGIMRLIKNANYQGEILFDSSDGQIDILQLSNKELRKLRSHDIAMVFQEPMTALNCLMPIGRQITEVLLVKHGWQVMAARQRAIELLLEVGIVEPEQQLNLLPHQFSGGQRQRILLAMALAGSPKLLIADEPTTALDASLRVQMLDLLQKIQCSHNTAILLISHDLHLVRSYAQQVVVMAQGSVVEQGDTGTIFSNPKYLVTQQLLASRLPKKISNDENPLISHAAPVLSVKSLTVNYATKTSWYKTAKTTKSAVNNINFSLSRGCTLAVIGESGSGKTSMAMAILDLLSYQGAITVHGSSWQQAKANTNTYLAQRKAVQIVFQDPFSSLSPKLKILEVVTEGMHLLGENTEKSKQQLALQALQSVGLTIENTPNLLQRYPHQFSGGQRQRIAIARALLVEPDVLVLDEPSSALDVVRQKELIELLQQLQQQRNLSYLLITHDLAVARALADNVMVLRNGEVVEFAPAQQLFEQPQHSYSKQLLMAQAKLLL